VARAAGRTVVGTPRAMPPAIFAAPYARKPATEGGFLPFFFPGDIGF